MNNVTTGQWTQTGNTTERFYQHRDVLLPNGLVIVAGGGEKATNAAELYDWRTGTWTPTSNMNSARLMLTF